MMRTVDTETAQRLVEPLTGRERQILALLAEGYSRPEIAAKLMVGLASVKTHLHHLYGKLGVNTKRQAFARATELGLLEGAPTWQAATPDPRPEPQPGLPLQLTSFIGREKEIAEVRCLLSQARLVTLTGAGGSGKTRLAFESTGGLLDKFAGGVWLAELAPLNNPWLVPQVVAAALGLREMRGRAVTEILLDYLRPKQLLLVLDNCEHLVQACAELAESLLRACPQLTILATSREALNISGEATFLVPTLASPTNRDLQSVEALGRFDAVRLFVDRAQAGRPGFQVTSGNARAVGQVCRKLDGIPLAIELAAARMKVLGVDEIAAGLDNRFQLLRGGSRTALPRHQTLQALIDWSYDLLSEPERALLRPLSVFAGGWTLEAAKVVAVGAAVDAGAVLDLLSQLVSKSLVYVQHDAGRPTRYSMLETIRQYALAKLEAGGEADGARQQQGTLQAVENENYDPGPPVKVSVTAAGSGSATQLGRFAYSYTVVIYLNPDNSGTGTLYYDFVAANGDHLYSVGEGFGDVAQGVPNMNHVVEEHAIIGGTGRFAGATGRFTVDRLISHVTSITSGTIDGYIVLANGN